MFQPLEISDDKISRYDRMKPIDYKPEKINVILEPEIKEFLVEGIDKKEVIEVQRYEELIKLMNDQYNKSITKQNIKRGEKDWYKYCSITIERLSEHIDVELLKTFVVCHIFDSLDVADKKIIIESLLNKKSLSLIEKTTKEYIDDTIEIKKGDKHGFILIENNKLVL